MYHQIIFVMWAVDRRIKLKIKKIIKELKYIKKQVGNIKFEVFANGQKGYYTPKKRDEHEKGTFIGYDSRHVCVFIEEE